MSKSSCFFKELLGTPCGSYKVGDIDIDEITTIDRCTRDIYRKSTSVAFEGVHGTEVQGRFNISVLRQV